MAKKRKADEVPATADKTTSSDRHTSPRVVFYVPEELLGLIDREAETNDRTRTAELIRALKGYYSARGLWPPPSSSQD